MTQECKLACGGKERFGTAASKFNEQRILFCTIVVVHLRYIFNDSMEFDGNNYFWISFKKHFFSSVLIPNSGRSSFMIQT